MITTIIINQGIIDTIGNMLFTNQNIYKFKGYIKKNFIQITRIQ